MLRTRIMILTVLLVTYCGHVHTQSNADVIQRCKADTLTFFEALGRNDWSLRCGYISSRTFDYYVFDDVGNMRHRALYDTYYRPGKLSDWFSAPRQRMANCERHGYTASHVCTSGNAFMSAPLLFAPGELAVYDAYTQQVQQLIVVEDSATLDNLHYREQTVTLQSEKSSVEQINIVTLHTQRGKSLTVTQDHPLLLSTGILKSARYLSVQDTLIDQYGELDRIVSKTTSQVSAQLYDTQINTVNAQATKLDQIVVTQGFLSGYLVSNGVQKMGKRLSLRDKIPLTLTASD